MNETRNGIIKQEMKYTIVPVSSHLYTKTCDAFSCETFHRLQV